jgi:hypothetical protein
MPTQPSKQNILDQYVTVAERIMAFYQSFPQGRICTSIVHHDLERGFVLMRAEVYRNPDDALPAATGHAYEFKSEGYVQRTSYIEVCETSCVGRALAMAGFEVKRGIASREEMEKNARAAREEPAREPEKPEREKSATAPPVKQGESRQSEVRQSAVAEQSQGATEEQKQNILDLLEMIRPGDRRAQRRVLVEMTGKESRDDLTGQEAASLIAKLKKELSDGSI